MDNLLPFEEYLILNESIHQNEKIFSVDDKSDCFYVVLRGCIRICRKLPDNRSADAPDQVHSMLRRSSLEREISYVNVGQIFGYVDFALERRRCFNAGKDEKDHLLSSMDKLMNDIFL